MSQEKASIVIHRSPANVYAFLSATEQWPRWHTQVRSVTVTSPTPEAVGTVGVMRSVLTVFGANTRFEITALQPSFRLSLKNDRRSVSYVEDFTLHEKPSGTEVVYTVSYRCRGVLKLLTPLFAPFIFTSNCSGSLQRLKSLLESASDTSDEDSYRRASLRERIEQEQQRLYRTRLLNRRARSVGSLLTLTWPIVGGLVGFAVGSLGLKMSLALLAYGLFFFLIPAFNPVYDTEKEIQRLQTELEVLEIPTEPGERKAERMFSLHQGELEKYYVQARQQASWIFAVGIVCILAGFAVIAFALYLISYRIGDRAVQEKVVAAVLGGAGGILANFIAVVYLRMFANTVRSLTEFHNRLVLTHHLHFGNFLASKITAQSLREQTVSMMAEHLAQAVNRIPADAEGKDDVPAEGNGKSPGGARRAKGRSVLAGRSANSSRDGGSR